MACNDSKSGMAKVEKQVCIMFTRVLNEYGDHEQKQG